MPDTAARVGDNTIRSSPRQSFSITSRASNSVTESSKVCNIASEYDIIEVEDLTGFDEEPQALEATTEKGRRKRFDEDFVFVGGSLDPDLRNILDREDLPDSYISGTHGNPSNGSTESIPTSYQDPEYQQLSEQAVHETSPSAVDPENN
ncbi:hypothetical protein B0O99DRAFT_600946 [Bisporella sp. PMI_857]|nr:hypothetical protein B0O99DRAFT_600946 [Bisporella sp. PMI_857]